MFRLSAAQRQKFEALAATLAGAKALSDGHSFAPTIFPVTRARVISGFPYTEYAPPVQTFWDLVEGAGLIAAPFDWPAWANEITNAGMELLDPQLVASLSPADLRRYLTMLQRAERFTDGTWGNALRNGVFDMLLERILALDTIDAANNQSSG